MAGRPSLPRKPWPAKYARIPAGDRLVGRLYVPIPIDPLAGDILQGHSRTLDLLLRWEQGWLAWHDPATGGHIATFASARDRANREQAARAHAEARIRQLEDQLRNRPNP